MLLPEIEAGLKGQEIALDGIAVIVNNKNSMSDITTDAIYCGFHTCCRVTLLNFISYILSQEGQKIVEDNGYISVGDDAAAYAGTKPSGKIVIAGSSSITPVMEKLKEGYKEVNPNAEIEIQQSDSPTEI